MDGVQAPSASASSPTRPVWLPAQLCAVAVTLFQLLTLLSFADAALPRIGSTIPLQTLANPLAGLGVAVRQTTAKYFVSTYAHDDARWRLLAFYSCNTATRISLVTVLQDGNGTQK